MKNIYETASDLHVRGSYIYVNTEADGYAYSDSEFKNKIDAATLANTFNMGTAIIVDGGVSYRANSLKVAGKVATLSYVKVTSGSTVSVASINSAEYTG